MSKVTIDIDFDDFLSEDENFNDFLIRKMRHGLLNKLSQTELAEIKESIANHFSTSVQEEVGKRIEQKLDSFMAEEISIRGEWGKPSFVGSIDDYLKKRFDDALLHTVGSNGQKVTGCQRGEGQTYIEWLLHKRMQDKIETEVKSAERNVIAAVTNAVKAQMEEIKTKAAGELVSKALAGVMPDQRANV